MSQQGALEAKNHAKIHFRVHLTQHSQLVQRGDSPAVVAASSWILCTVLGSQYNKDVEVLESAQRKVTRLWGEAEVIVLSRL